MKGLKKITLTQFRNYSAVSFEFPARITCITGRNGSGKTNLLDAVYYLCYTKSYFSAYQQNTAQNGTDGFRVEGVFAYDGQEEVIACKWQQGKKEVSANGVVYDKVTEHIGKYAAVMIAPDDLELVNGGSEQRRKWVDSILCQTDTGYFEALMQYQRILLQRNAWLKQEHQRPTNDYTELEFFNSRLHTHGTYIYERRQVFLARLMPLLDRYYHELSGGREELAIEYKSHLQAAPFGQLLQKSLRNDLQLQRTLKGIHKDDWELGLNNLPLKQFASQGQKKSFLFAMKLAQYAYLEMEMGHRPMLLLDDIFEKLDDHRIRALMNIIKSPSFGQVFLTDTDKQRVQVALSLSPWDAVGDISFVEV